MTKLVPAALSEAHTISASKGASLLRKTPQRLPDEQDGVIYDRPKLAERVVRRFTAEKLTKQWLMGMRRGFLKLMKPSISNWDDVFRAFAQLKTFMENFRDQIRFVRPGATRLADPKFEAKLEKILDRVDHEIWGARASARYWRKAVEGTDPMNTRKEEGEKMFTLYRDKFDEVVDSYVPKGRGGLTKQIPLVKLLDKALKLLRDDAAVIRKHDEANPDTPFEPETAFTDFDLGGMKVIVDDGTLRPGQVNEYAKHLTKAKRLLEGKGFGKAWYGEVFIQCKSCGGENQYGKEFGVGAYYRIGPNTVSIFNRPSKYITELMIHELGHRWWYKNMTQPNRLRFEEWIGSGLVPVSVYGGKHHREAFAEAFAWFVLGKKMTPQQVETFKLVALGGRFARDDRRVSRRVALRFGKDIQQLLVEDLDPDKIAVYLKGLVRSISNLGEVERELGMDLRGMTKLLGGFDHSDDLYHNGESVLKHIKWVLQDVHRLTADKDQEMRGVLQMAALLHDLGKAYTHKLSPTGHHQFHGHAQKSVLIAEKLVAKLAEENADLAELIVQLVKHHDSFLALISARRQGQTKSTLKYLNKFMREAIYTKGHMDKLLLFTQADAARSKVFDETLKGIDEVLDDLAKVEGRAEEEAKAQAERERHIERSMGKVRQLLEREAPDVVGLLPDLQSVKRALGKSKRYDVLKQIARVLN